MCLDIGSKIKALRKQKGLSILQLSKMSGVSTGMISQIERNLVMPTVVSIWRIAKALDTNISYFFDENAADKHIVIRQNEHRIIKINNCGNYKQLTPNNNDRLFDMAVVTLKTGEQLVKHDGQGCAYILSGSLNVELNTENWQLNIGDSIYLKAAKEYRCTNINDEDCVFVWSVTSPFL